MKGKNRPSKSKLRKMMKDMRTPEPTPKWVKELRSQR